MRSAAVPVPGDPGDVDDGRARDDAAAAAPPVDAPLVGAPVPATPATYVAVGDVEVPDAGETLRRRTAERRAIGRRLHDAALRSAAHLIPVFTVPLLAAVAAVVGRRAPTPLETTWVVAMLVGCGAWLLLGRACRTPGRTGWLADTRRRRQLVTELAAVLLAGLALAPWLPVAADGAVDPWLVATSLAVPALAAGWVLAPLGRAAGWSLAPGVSAALAGLQAGAEPGRAPLVHVAVLVLPCIATASLVYWRHRDWTAARRAGFQHDDRVRELEEECDAAWRADHDKTRFLAAACHDLRQPMHALGLFAATLERRLEGSPDELVVRNLMRSINGLERSFTAMLDVSRLDAGSVEPSLQYFSLRDLFRRLHMHFIGQAEQRGLGLRFSPGGKSVCSDPQLLERILGNLIQNAIRYTETGGIVVVARTTTRFVNIEVWDTGVGIAADDLPRVFEEFSQVGRGRSARGQGLGMGLAIVKRLAKLLDHRLSVRSRPGRGTVFRVGIPIGGLADIEAETAAAETRPMQVVLPHSVLVVDDERPIREGLQMLLEEWGYQVATAASLDEARRVVDRMGEAPDLVISDLHLGENSPDGLAVIKGLREHCGRPLPAMLVTGDTSHEQMRRATESGHPVLFKPVQPRRLFDALRALAPAGVRDVK